MKRVFRILIWIILGLAIALALLPFVFKGKVQEVIKEEISKTVNAEVNFADVSLSIFKDFPSLSVKIDELSIIGIQDFADLELVTAEHIYLKTDLASIIKSGEGIKIYKFSLDKPVINLLVNADGKANYDIAKESAETSSSSSSMFGKVEAYEITEGTISYTDIPAKMNANIENLNHSGSGDFSDITFNLDTKTEIDKIDFSADGISYLNNAKLTSDLNLGVDLDKSTYTFNENLTRLNDLDLAFTGSVNLAGEAINMDLDVKAPNNKVSSILSLIPSSYSGNFEGIESSGNSYLAGTIKGQYNSLKEIYPKINLKINIDDGNIKYPDLPFPIKDINLDLLVQNNKADLSDLAADISKFTFLINEDRMVGKMKLSNITSKPHLAGLIDGTLDLKAIAKAFPIEGTTLTSGLIKSNIKIDAHTDDIINEKYQAIIFNGDITATNLDVQYEDYPLKAEKLSMTLSPAKITSSFDNAQVGNSDFKGTATVSNPLAFITKEAEAKTSINAQTKLLDVDQLMSYGTTEKTDNTESTVDTLQDLSFFNELNIAATYSADQVKYENYSIKALKVEGGYDDDNLKVTRTSMSLDGQAVELRGDAQNVSDYVFNNGELTGKFYVDAKSFNANKFLAEDSSESEDITEPFIIPANLNIDIYPEIQTLIYDNYTLKDTEGKLSIKNGIAALTDTYVTLFDGKLNLEGLYDSTNPDEPTFDLKYNINKMDFGKMAASSESFKILVPIGKYMTGMFNSTLVMSGPLKKDMMPDLANIDASGFLETLEGQITGFEPLEKISKAIGVDKIKDWSLKGTKNWFDIKDGKVILQPHDHVVDDMLFNVAGSHSINQEIDYKIKAVIPREKLEKDKLGKNLEYGMDFIEKEAGSRGVNIDLGDMIYLDIFLTGSVTKPKIKVIPVGSGGKTIQDVVKDEVTKQVNVLKDTVRTELENRTEVIKDAVTKKVESKVDTVKEQVKEKVNSEVDKQKEALKEKLKAKVDTSITQVLTDTLQTTLENKAEEILGTESKETIDSLKSKIKDWNPFKKKKN